MILILCDSNVISPPSSVIIFMLLPRKSRSDCDKVKMQASPSLLGTQHQREGFGYEVPWQSNILSRGCVWTSICLRLQNRRLAAALWAVWKLGLIYLHTYCLLCFAYLFTRFDPIFTFQVVLSYRIELILFIWRILSTWFIFNAFPLTYFWKQSTLRAPLTFSFLEVI